MDLPPTRPTLSSAAVQEIGATILRLVRLDVAHIELIHTARSITRVQHDRIRDGETGDDLSLTLWFRDGRRDPVTVRVNQVDRESLRAYVAFAESLATTQRSSGQPDVILAGPRSHVPVALSHESTNRVFADLTHALLPDAVATVTSTQLACSAFLGLMARTTCIMNSSGLSAVAEETDAELTVTARHRQGSASGWAGRAHRNWDRIDPIGTAREAVTLASYGRDPVAAEPGRRTVILGPSAVAQLCQGIHDAFSMSLVMRGASPLSDPNGGSRMGQRVLDPRLSMRSDPNDPEGGYLPFFPAGSGAEVAGFPLTATTWIENGILRALAESPTTAARNGRSRSHPAPTSFRLAGGHATVEGMIAQSEEAIYVNHFSLVQMLDLKTGLVTGITRDGCFLVRHGKIDRPVRDFRFRESPWIVFNQLVAVGAPQRAALGYVVQSWPRPPVIVPPMLVRDFNFSGLADAV